MLSVDELLCGNRRIRVNPVPYFLRNADSEEFYLRRFLLQGFSRAFDGLLTELSSALLDIFEFGVISKARVIEFRRHRLDLSVGLLQTYN